MGLSKSVSRGFIFTLTFAASVTIGAAQTRIGHGFASGTQLARQEILAAYGRLPLSFEENRGQVDPEVRYLSRESSYKLFLTSREAVLVLGGRDARPPVAYRGMVERPNRSSTRSAELHLKFLGANPTAQVFGGDELPGKSNYFLGDDPRTWRTDIPNYANVKYHDLYPGVDLILYGSQGQLEYDFVVAPGGDPAAIRVGVQETEGARIDSQGDLILRTRLGLVRLLNPRAYQESDGIRRAVACRYVIRGKHDISFKLGGYDQSKALVIDPVLTYSTFLGSFLEDAGQGIAVDGSGNAYITGYSDFPGGSRRVLVTKLNPGGTAVVYSTFLAGSGFGEGFGIAVDSSGSAYVTGLTGSGDFPTTPGAFQTAFGGGTCGTGSCADAFVTKLNAQGSGLVYSTFLGGSGDDEAFGIALDTSGNAYVTGRTSSIDLPLVNPLQATCNQCSLFNADAFVSKLNPTGSALVYSTYLGGSSNESGQAIAVDASGSAYVTGQTSSADFPTANPFQQTFGGGGGDAFVAKLSATGSTLIYSSYLGGSNFDSGIAIAVDSSSSAYVTGGTRSADFPTLNALQPTFRGGSQHAFVTKVSSRGNAVVYSTYLGGSGFEAGSGIALDSAGDVYVVGQTESSDFPTVNALQANCRLDSFGFCSLDVFVAELNPAGTALLFASYLGGSDFDEASAVAVDSAGSMYMTGKTVSSDFPVANAVQPNFGGGQGDAFVAKIRITQPPVVNAGPDQVVECSGGIGTPVTLDGSGSSASDPNGDTLSFKWTDANGNVLGTAAIVKLTLQLGSYTFFLTVDNGRGAAASSSVNVTVRDTTPPVLALSTNLVTKVISTAAATSMAVNLSGIASATDSCDPNPVTINNAPTLFPVGITTVTFTARDASGNSSQKQLAVQVVYNFNGYISPISNDGSSIFNSGKTIPVKFQLSAADNTLVSNATAKLQVFLVGVGGSLQPMPVTSSGGSNTGNSFRFDPMSKQYEYNLSTQGYSPGSYLLRTLLNDQRVHDLLVSIQ